MKVVVSDPIAPRGLELAARGGLAPRPACPEPGRGELAEGPRLPTPNSSNSDLGKFVSCASENEAPLDLMQQKQ